VVGSAHPTKLVLRLRYGKFQRIISLPEKFQHDQVTAKYEQGVLQLTLPKLVEDKDKIVKVEITH
jgi:HSP20 family protein